MTLQELSKRCFSRPTIAEPVTLYVFATEDSADEWVLGHYIEPEKEEHHRCYTLLMAIKSDMVLDYIIQKSWCEKEVQQFYAVAPDTLVVVLEMN